MEEGHHGKEYVQDPFKGTDMTHGKEKEKVGT